MKVKVNASWFGKKIILVLILSILFLTTIKSLSSQDEINDLTSQLSIRTDKSQYVIGEKVNVSVTVPDISNYKLYYEYNNFTMRYMGDYTQFSFEPLGIGTHYLVLRDLGNNELVRYSFEVVEGEKPAIEEQPAPIPTPLPEPTPTPPTVPVPVPTPTPTPAAQPGLRPLKQFFKQQEDAVFNFNYEKKQKLKLLKKPSQFRTWETPGEKIVTEVIDSAGQKIDVPTEIEQLEDGQFRIIIPKARAFRPGQYKLRVELTTEGVTYEEEQSFLWGVLAINTQKSIYLPNETAFIGMAVLDDAGRMVCDADVTLEITDPLGAKTILSTTDKTISVSDECNVYGVTNLPDYYATYIVSGAGNYSMNLTAITSNGPRSLIDSFIVQDSVEFDVARNGPTRIYPFVPYTMNFTIKANQNYFGIIREYVPASFEITPQPGLTITIINDTKALEWNAVLVEGQTYNLSYEFDAPDISPYLFILGKLQIGNWSEERNWMIASDYNTYNVVLNFSYNSSWVVPEGVTWVLVEAWGGGGAGGGGGSGNKNGGGGGSGGQYVKKNVSVSPGQNYSIVVASAVAGDTGNGTNGSDTTFNSSPMVVAKGGARGQKYSGTTGIAGLGSTAGGVGDLVYAGGNGANGSSSASGGGGGGAGSTGSGGNASTTTGGTGTSLLGGNGGAGTSSNNAAGGAGSNYSGGGGGSTGTGTSGGGAQGFLNLSYNIIDTTPPTVNINISRNNTVTTSITPSVEFNFTDSISNTTNCTLYFNGTGYNYTTNVSNKTQTTLTVNTSLNAGRYDVWVNCTDESNNIGKSGVLNITIDTPPSVSNAQSTPRYVINSTAVNISATVTDNNAVSTVIARIYYPNGTSAANYSMTNSSGSVYWNASYTVDFNVAGLYNVTIFANDTAGTSGTATTNFTPILNLTNQTDIVINGTFTDWDNITNINDIVGDSGSVGGNANSITRNTSYINNPDIVLKQISSPVLLANQASTINVTINVTNGNGTNGFNWTVNVTLWNTTKLNDVNISSWSNTSALCAGDVVDVLPVDIDNNGFPDLITIGSDFSPAYYTYLWQNPSNANSTNITTWNSTYTTSVLSQADIFAADINNDGFNDIMIVGSNSKITLLINPANGSMNIEAWNITESSLTNDSYGIFASDIDNNGYIDIITVDYTEIRIWHNPGNASSTNISKWAWTNSSTIRGLYSVYAADIDNDGYTDIITGTVGFIGRNLTIWHNPGNSNSTNITAWNKTTKTLIESLYSVFAADIDNDGYADIITGGNTSLSLWNNPGNANSTNISTWIMTSSSNILGYSSFFASDIDNDGYNDVIAVESSISSYNVTIWNNPGNANSTNISTWNKTSVPSSSYILYDITVVDIDKDGDNDVVSGSWDGVSIYNNSDIASTYINSSTKTFVNQSNNASTYSLSWTPSSAGNYTLMAIADNGNSFIDAWKWNNKLVMPVTVVNAGGGNNFDIVNYSLANNATYLFAKIAINGSLDFSTSTKYYALYLSTNDPTTGSQYTAGGGTLPFLYDYRLQVNNSVCTIYNYTNQSQGDCNYSNNSNTIEISANLSLINMTNTSVVNITFETGGSSYDFAPDYNSFLQYNVSAGGGGGSDSTPPNVSINTSLDEVFTSNTSPSVDFNFTDAQSTNASCIAYFYRKCTGDGECTGAGTCGIGTHLCSIPFNGTNSSTQNNTQTTLTVSTTLTAANYSVYVNCTDNSSNVGNSSTIHIIVDNVAPTVNINASLDETLTNNTQPNVDFNFTDRLSSSANCTLYFDDTGYNMSATSNNSQKTLTANASLSAKNYSVYVNCTDAAGNINKSSVIHLLLNTVSACQVLSSPNFIYELNQSLSSNSGVCINITANNVTVDGNGFNITYAVTGSGIAIFTKGYYNITVRNLTIAQTSSSRTGSPGINLNSSNSNSIYNVTFSINGDDSPDAYNYAIYLYNTSNTNITNTSITASSTCDYCYGIYLQDNSTQNMLDNNRIVSSGYRAYGIYLYNSSDNIINRTSVNVTDSDTLLAAIYVEQSQRNIITYTNISSAGTGIRLATNANYTNITYSNITGTYYGIDFLTGSQVGTFIDNSYFKASSTGYGPIYADSGATNTTINNSVIEHNRSSSSSVGAIHIVSATGWRVANTNITTAGTYAPGIYLDPSDNFNGTNIRITTTGSGDSEAVRVGTTSTSNYIYDSILNATNDDDIYFYSTGSGTLNVINATFTDKSWSSNSAKLKVYWYLDAHVNDTNSNNIDSANVTAWDNNSNQVFTTLTNSTGWIARQTLQEYWQNATTSYYYTNYTVNASKSGYSTSSAQVNLTTNKEISLTLSPIYYITNPPSGTKFVRENSTNTQVTQTGQLGVVKVLAGLNTTSGNYSGIITFNFSQDINVSGLVLNISWSQAKSVLHNSSAISQIINRSLLIPRVANSSRVYVCPYAQSLDGVKSSCSGRVYISTGQTVNGMTVSEVSYDGENYYQVDNVTGSGGGEAGSGWANASFDRCKNITISNSGSEPLVDFPAYINLTYDGDMQPDFVDIRFYDTYCDNNGSMLDYEIENYTTSTNAHVWVRIPNLPSTGTTISVYYKNNTAVSSGENASGVWDSYYKGVWHMQKVNATDSTSNGNNGTASGGVTLNSTGKIDGADDFNRSQNQIIVVEDSENTITYNDFSISAWIKVPNATVADDYYIASQSDKCIGRNASWFFNIADESPNQLRFQVLSIESYRQVYSGVNLTDNEWHHVMGVRGSGNLTIYIDGVLVNTSVDGDAGTSFTPLTNISIGGDPCAATEAFNGTIDEVRISTTNRSATWINMSYLIVNNQSQYVSFGNEISIINACQDLNSANTTYYLSQNVNSTGTCFNITAYNVTLDGQGFTINYSTDGTVGYGVYSNQNLSVIKNAVITEGSSSGYYKHGIYFSAANNGTIQNNTIRTAASSSRAIYLDSTKYNSILENNISGSAEFPIYLSSSDSNIIRNNFVNETAGQGSGMYIYGSANITIDNNTVIATGGTGRGINLAWSTGANLTNNKVNSSGAISYMIQADSASQCNHSIDSSNLAEGSPVNFTKYASNEVYDGVDYSSYGEVIFACSSNITLKGSTFNKDTLHLAFVNASTFENNIINTALGYGLVITSSSYNTFRNISINNSGAYGIELTYDSSYNNFTNISINTDSKGIQFFTSNSNTFSELYINTTAWEAIDWGGADNITIYSATIRCTHIGLALYSGGGTDTFKNLDIICDFEPIYISNIMNISVTDSKLNRTNGADEVYVDSDVSGAIWNFTNVSRSDGSTINVSWNVAGNGTLNYGWWLDVNVTSGGSGLADATINATDVFGTSKTNTTNAQGLTRMALVEYIRNNTGGANITYYSNYTVNASLNGSVQSQVVNMSTNRILAYTFDINPLSIYFVSPTDNDSAVVNRNWSYVNVSVSDASNTSAFIDWNNSLVGWWRFNNESGENDTFFRDWSTYGNNGSCSGENCPNYTSSGKFGTGLSFDGSNDYMLIPGGGLSSNPMTVVFWMKKTADNSADEALMVTKGNWFGGEGIEIGVSPGVTSCSGECSFWTRGSGSTSAYTNVRFDTGSWVHVAIVYNGTTATIYKDGSPVAMGASTIEQVAASNYDTLIGCGPGPSYYSDELFDDVRIFNRALSPEEINASYNAGIYRLYHNFTNLADGNYNYTAYAQDEAGNVNQTEERTLTVDTTLPSIQFVPPTDNDSVIVNRNWSYVNVSVSDASNTSAFIDWNNSLVGWWRFNNESGENNTFFKDWSTYGNNGTCDSGSGYCPNYTDSGKFGKAMSFDGSDDYVDAGDIDDIDAATELSGCAWVYHNSITDDHAIFAKNAGATSGILFWRDETGGVSGRKDTYSVWVRESGGDFTWKQLEGVTGASELHKWTHVCFTIKLLSTTGLRLYINGVEDINSPIDISDVADMNSGSEILTIGFVSPEGRFLDGLIDDVRIFNRALSPEEINASYNAGLYRLYHNFTNLTEGNYTYRAYAQDEAGNVNSTEGRTITVESTTLTACQDLTSANTIYTLSNNVSSSGTCFNILADNITLDCQGYAIDYCTASQDMFAVNNTGGYDNITIQNCNISTPSYNCDAIYFQDAMDENIINNSITIYNWGVGLYLGNSSNANIINNTIINNGSSVASNNIYLYLSDNVTIRNNTLVRGTASAWPYGHPENIVISSSKNTSMYNNTLTSARWHSVSVDALYYDSAYYNHTIDQSNTLNGKSIKYIGDVNDTVYRDQNWSTYDVIVAGVNNVTLTNLTLSSISFTNDYMNGELSNSTIISTDINPLNLWQDSYPDIQNNFVVKNNIINNYGNAYSVTLASSLRNITFINNTITNTGTYPAFYQGAGGNGGGTVYSLYNNTFNSTNSDGVIVESGDAPLVIEGNTITTAGSTDYEGLYLDEAEQYTLKNNKITSSGIAIYSRLTSTGRNHIVLINDSVLNSTGNYDLYVYDSIHGSMNLTNVTLVHNNISFSSSGNQTVNFFWYLEANVTDSAGNPLGSANITIKDKDATTAYSGLTNTSGKITRQAILEYWINRTNSYYYSNYTVNATKAGYSSNQTSVNLTTNQQLSLALTSLPINISINLNPSTVNTSEHVDVYGRVNDSEGTGLPNQPINIYINDTQYYYNPSSGLLEANSSYNQPTTDSSGNYSYTFSAPTNPGNYVVKSNTTNTDYTAEANTTLTVEQYYINISLNLNPNPANVNQNISIYGHVNQSDSTNVTNSTIFIYINNSLVNITGGANLPSDWWNYSWPYRTYIKTESLVSTNLNYTIALVNLSTSDIISQGKMRSDCGDVRFADANKNELQYTLETSTCNTANTIFWVWTNLTGNANNTIYAYYGNSAITLKTDYTNPDLGLVAYLHFDNSSAYGENSTFVHDFSKNGNNGTCTACPTWNSTAKYGGAFEFNYDGQYLDIGDLDSVENVSEVTISEWIKRRGPSQYVEIGWQTYDPQNNLGIEVWSDGMFYFDVADVSSSVNTGNDANWHHLVLTFNGSQAGDYGKLKGYVDGVEYSLYCTATKTGITNENFLIGNMAGATSNGTIDEIRIYNRTLSADEILAIYNSTKDHYIENQTETATDSYGDYNYTFTAPSTAGNYIVKVNTTYNGMNAEANTTLTVQSTSLSSCQDLTTANTIYTLSNNVNSSGTCFNITANNITLDGQGYTINYSTTGSGYGVLVDHYNDSTIKNLIIYEGSTASEAKHGVYLNYSNNNLVFNNTIATIDSGSSGVYEYYGGSNNISMNQINTSEQGARGIYNIESGYSDIADNIIYAVAAYGIHLRCSDSTLRRNRVSSDSYGIYFQYARNITLTENNVTTTTDHSYILQYYGSSISDYNHTIGPDNLAEGKPVNYTFNAQNVVYDGIDFTQFGEVIFGYGNNITIRNSNFSDDNLIVHGVGNLTISNNQIITNNSGGLDVESTYNANITGNNVTTNCTSCAAYELYYLNNFVFANNTVTTFKDWSYGLFLYGTNNGTISNNTITTNGGNYAYGIYLYGDSSSSNLTFSNTTISTQGSYAYGFYITGTNDNITLSGLSIKTAGTTDTIYLYSITNNISITDTILNGSSSGTNLSIDASGTGGKLNLTNVTTPIGAPINISFASGANTTVNYGWWLDANVTSGGSALEGATVNATDTLGTIQTNTTDANGLTRLALLEYTRNNTGGANITYYSNYTVNATKTNYNPNSTPVNLTQSKQIVLVLSASNIPPTVDTVSNVSDQTPTADSTTAVQVNFTASDANGVDDLNDSTARAIFTRNSVTREGNCTPNDINSSSTNYNCSVAMMYYDTAGDWTINVTVIDNSQLSAYNATTDFTYQELLYIQVDPVVFGFGDYYPGDSNKAALSNPLLIDNLGNVNLTQINITAYDLVNGSYTLGVSNITVNVSDGAQGTALQHAVPITIPYANVSADVNGVDANESLYFYISLPPLPPLKYSSSTDWVITADK